MGIPDTNALLRRYLVSQSAITNEVSTRVYSGRLPKDFNDDTVAKTIMFLRSGGMSAIDGPEVSPSYQFRCIGANEGAAQSVYRIFFDVMKAINHATVTSYGTIIHAIETSPARDMIDPDVETFHYVMSFWSITMRAAS